MGDLQAKFKVIARAYTVDDEDLFCFDAVVNYL